MRRRQYPIFWMTDAWRPIAAFVYLGICVFDFVIAPCIYELTNYVTRGPDNIVELALRFNPASQPAILAILHSERVWVPLTLSQSGLFHIAFGAILGAASWTHGQERIKRIQASMQGSTTVYEKKVQQGSEVNNTP